MQSFNGRIMKILSVALCLSISINALSQEIKSNVEFVGNKVLVLQASRNLIFASGKLSSGETVKSGCEHGSCYIRIEYKGRTVDQNIGEDITKLAVYEFDFGADGDKEIVVVNSLNQTSWLMIYTYSRGIIQKLLEKEISTDRTVLKKDFIELYKAGNIDQIWYYFKGEFWEMKPLDTSKFKYK
jgi:hypothetical protein